MSRSNSEQIQDSPPSTTETPDMSNFLCLSLHGRHISRADTLSGVGAWNAEQHFAAVDILQLEIFNKTRNKE